MIETSINDWEHDWDLDNNLDLDNEWELDNDWYRDILNHYPDLEYQVEECC